jgi:hypothetical protein
MPQGRYRNKEWPVYGERTVKALFFPAIYVLAAAGRRDYGAPTFKSRRAKGAQIQAGVRFS